ncbi:hypothetical protein, partial [Vibrio metoecus]|uniref:hypothetical protein n=1 Tax=Vibrio metoecus TaxID=1481663 RepID=UPI001C3EF66E
MNQPSAPDSRPKMPSIMHHLDCFVISKTRRLIEPTLVSLYLLAVMMMEKKVCKIQPVINIKLN